MATKANKGSTYYRVGSQNQQILAKYWGTGKTFTLEGLTEKLNAMSPGARISELRDNGFNVKSNPSHWYGRKILLTNTLSSEEDCTRNFTHLT